MALPAFIARLESLRDEATSAFSSATISDQLESARILFLGEARGYYCRRDRINTTIYDEYPLGYWVRRSKDSAELHRYFLKDGITHMLVNRMEFGKWQENKKRFLDLDERETKVWRSFIVTYLRLVFEDKGAIHKGRPGHWTVVYEVKSS